MLEALQWIECAQGLDEEGAGQRCPSSTQATRKGKRQIASRGPLSNRRAGLRQFRLEVLPLLWA